MAAPTGAERLLHEDAFRAAEGLVVSWPVGTYVHHTQLRKELDSGGVEFLITFSKPTPRQPVPRHVANVLVTVEPPSDALVISYAIESELHRHPASEPFQLAWLDDIITRQQLIEASVGLFKKKGEVREPRAFVPGEYGPSQPAAAAKAGKSKGGLRVSIKIRNDCSAACSIRS